MYPMLCQIFSSPRFEEMFLYVDRARGLEDVPQALLEHFGTPRPVMIIPLDERRRLARVEIQAVIEALRDKGYYLQMPPGGDVLSRDRAFSVEGDEAGVPGGE
ncbi:YcgL domain-containing protein [Kushneria aurantia]|uniref:YcgL domain-containing protein ACFFHW_17135 n=1 Tax=Kushneria aurantia TaxID=504092 RepID=A0ABV6G7N7_9GAMM|nr:YcgL domain-containing protein [Kushneria aurantia]